MKNGINIYINIIMSEQVDAHLLVRFKIVKKMGSGAYGHVFKVIDRNDQKTKALKKNFDAFTNSTDAQRTYRQIMFLFQLSHPNIVSMEDVFKAQNGKDIYILFEYMEADLFEVTRARNILSDRHRKFILYQIASSIYYLHSAGIIHRDLKPSNILVNEQCEAKICDFGLVRSIDDVDSGEEEKMTEYIATRWYRAPQILLGARSYCKAVDIWSYGCLMAEIFTGKALFPGNSTLNQIERVLKWTGVPSMGDLKCLKTQFGSHLFDIISTIKTVSHKQITGNMDPSCVDLLEKTLSFNPETRITIQQILLHPYFSEHFQPSEIVKSSQKIKVPINDSMKLSLREYRALIYEQISKNNLKKKQFTISRIRSRSLKTEQNSYEQRLKSCTKNIHRSISNDSDGKQSIKTIKKTEFVYKKKTFFGQPDCRTRNPSRNEEKPAKVSILQRSKEIVRKGHNYKMMKLVASKPKIWSGQKMQNKSMPLK